MSIFLNLLAVISAFIRPEAYPDSTIRKAEETIEDRAQDLGDKEVKEAYLILAEYYEKHTFELSKAVECQKQLMRIAEREGDINMLAGAASSVARMYVENARYDKAYKYADTALDLSRRIPGCKFLPDIYNTLGKISYYCDDYEKAKEYYRMISELPADSTNLRSKVLAINNSTVFLKDTAEIQKRMDQAIDICKQEGFTDLLAMVYCNLSIIYVNCGDLGKARKWHSLEETVPKNLENTLNYHRTSGIIALESGDYETARDELEKALEYASMGEFDRKRANLLSIINIVYACLSDFEQAYDALYSYNEIRDRIPQNLILRELMQTQQDAALEKEKQKQKYNILVFVIIVLVVFAVTYPLYINKVRRLKEKAMRLETEKIRKEKQEQEVRLRYEIREQNIKRQNDILAVKRLQQYQDEVLINDIITKLKDINSKFGQKKLGIYIYNIISELEHSKDNIIWQEMEQYLGEANSEFYDNLLADFPDLTVNERRLCTFLHMNMTTKEISMVTRKSINSITTARSRLRAKLNIKGDDQSIVAFLDKYSGKRTVMEPEQQLPDNQQQA